jgi:hypothetical protein
MKRGTSQVTQMEPKIVEAITRKVYSRFPEVEGKKPRVRRQKPPASAQGTTAPRFLLTYRGSASGPNGKTIPRWVRVVASEKGKIIKITTSRG